ncbi:unnamed protein product [Ophioblennius macclurei]
MPDHKLQPGGKLSRDPSPRPAMTTHLERQRDGEQEEKRRRENNPDIMRDKTRQRGMETMGGYYKRDVVPAPRPREEERDYREFRRHDDRRKNGRLQSNFEESEPPIESGRRKGDTFPRMKKGADHDRRIISTTERGDRRERDRPQRAETDKWEREYERTWQRDKYTERERAEFRGRHKEGGKSTGRRPVGDEHLHRRERYQDYDNVFQGPRGEMIESRHDGERHTARKREKLKADTSDREARVPSPRRRRDEGMHTGGREREKTHRRDGKRDTRSEGDSLERELSRETAKNRERERCAYSYSKSEGDIEEDFTGGAGRHRQASREQDGQRNRGREGDTSRRKGKEGRYREDERRAARPSDREGDRWRERDFRDDRGLPNDRRDDDRYRKRRERERDVNYRRDDVMGQSSRPPKESSSSRTSPQTQSSGEWSSDMDSDVRYKRGRNRDSYETESRREGERRGEKATDLQKGAERGEKWHPRGEKQPRDRAEIAYNNPEQRRMWLDPGRDKTSKEDFVDKERREKERSMGSQAERERVQEEPNDTRKTEGGSQGEMGEILRESDKRAKEYLPDSDGGMKESWQRDAERESVTDNTEESDREKDRSGDEAYIGKSDEDEYKDCQESWSDHSPVGSKGYEGDEQGTEWSMTREEYVDEDEEEQERENRKKLVFCVIGNTLPRSGVEQNNPKPGDYHRYSDEAKQQSDDDVEQEQETLTRGELPEGHSEYSPELRGTNITEEMRSKVDAPRGSMNRDSQTERLLKEWQERNKELGELQTSQVSSNPYPDVHSQMKEQIQPILDQISSGAMSPEEVEAIRIRLSGAWAMCDESKRRSQAPHLKWAKDVVREILGHSDERLEDETNTAAREDQGINPSENKDNKQDEVAQVTEEQPVPKVTADDQQSEPELEELMEGTRDDDDDRSKSWEEVELRNVLDSINRQKRNSRFFNAAQLYQQYNEEAQNFEILRQSRSDVVSANEDNAASPAPSPPPARRPLPALPVVQLPHTFSKTGSITSIQSLPLPVPPREGGRPSSPRLSVSLTQSPSLWRDLPGVRNSTELDDLSEDQRRLQEVRFEVVTSEASYCRSLDIVVEYFVKSKQLGSILSNQQKNCLFSRLTDVRAISHSFLAKLEQRVESDMMHFTVCDIIAQNCPRFKMVYVPYLTNQSYQDTAYQKLMNENPEFKRIVEKLERSPVCQRLPLRSFLVLPFQRITRIKLLVQNIVKRTTPGTPEAVHAIKALKLLEKLIQESNDSITQMKSIEALVSLSGKVDFACRTLPLIGPSRWLVREGPATELMDFSRKETERNVYMHLFNDYLLLSLQKEGGRFTVIDHAPVSDLRVENCRVKLHSLKKNLFRLHMSKKALLLRTDVQSDKLRWISALSRPHPEIDFSAAQDFEQMQCIRAFVAQQPDELSLEKADVILVHQQSTENGGEAEKEKEWVEGTKLSDRHRGWVPKSHLETISNSRVRQRNLSDALKLTTATAAV